MPENKTITSDAKQLVSLILIKFKTMSLVKGGSRGRVQGVRIPPPRDDLWFYNTTGILQKRNYVVYWC